VLKDICLLLELMNCSLSLACLLWLEASISVVRCYCSLSLMLWLEASISVVRCYCSRMPALA
jgi:hypothetical protein